MLKKLPLKPLLVAIAATGALNITVIAAAQAGVTSPTTSVATNDAVNVGKVNASSGILTESGKLLASTNEKLTKKKIFQSTQSETVISKKQMQALGPASGAAQALSTAPGITVRGYAGVASTGRYAISVRGAKVGWASVAGNPERNGITVLFDGIPMNDLVSNNGSWDSNEIPILQMISGINVIYGPGNPASRWFDSLGGTINFVPVQPSLKPSAEAGTFFGSNGTYGLHFNVKTGAYNGWSAVLAGGYTQNNTFRTGSFNAPSRAFAYFGKVVKSFKSGTFSVGGYINSANEFRPNFIPVSPIQGITTQGLNANAPLYSQATSGYYSSLPESLWFKQLTVQDYMLYSKLHLKLDRDVGLHEMLWYRHGHRIHNRINNFQLEPGSAPGNTNEYYYPNSDTFGDKLYFDWKLPYNTVKAGGYWIQQQENSLQANPQNNSIPQTAIASFTNPTVQYNSTTTDTTYLAGFIQDTIKPISGLNITPGLSAVEFATQFYNNGTEGIPYVAPSAVNFSATPNGSKTFTKLEPSIGLHYAPVKWGAAYANYAITYQNANNGAFGAYNGNIVNYSTLQPVKSTDYEIGAKFLVKSWLFLHDFTFNVNYYNDHLSNETIPITLANGTERFAGANSTLNGVNLTVADSPNWHWHMYANLGLSHDYYNSYTPSGGGITSSGLPASYSPNMTFTAGAYYRTYLDGILISPNLVDQYTSSQYLFNNLTGAPSYQTQGGYNVLNAGITLKTEIFNRYVPTLKNVSLSAGITNLLGRKYNPIEYITSGGYFGGNSAGTILADPGAPRQYYVAVSAKF
ncbi:TonB-dependent receptor [Acidithiobacillus ferrivorans]|uniref:Putative Porin n=1 Tax=mine drainage metagenome TaxID=410659 RepID=E6QAD1_9ZZZZ|nr:TonB-dependent receptor [Acidithiobacillus ferrivorans]